MTDISSLNNDRQAIYTPVQDHSLPQNNHDDQSFRNQPQQASQSNNRVPRDSRIKITAFDTKIVPTLFGNICFTGNYNESARASGNSTPTTTLNKALDASALIDRLNHTRDHECGVTTLVAEFDSSDPALRNVGVTRRAPDILLPRSNHQSTAQAS